MLAWETSTQPGMRNLLIIAAALGFLVEAGCRNSDEDPDHAAAETADSSHHVGNPPVDWTTGPTTPARRASYMVRDEGGAVADISLMIQSGGIGELRATVNQWRAQLGASPLDQTAFERTTQPLATPAGEAVVVDIIGLVDGAESAYDGRLVAAVVSNPTETWIFRMRGNAALVGAQKQAFLDWARTVEPDVVAPPASPPEPAPLPPLPPLPPLTARALDPGPGRQPAWQLPAGWVTEAPEPPACAAFSVPSKRGDDAKLTVTLLAGDGGGALANVNRWRIQTGLPLIPRNDLAAATQSLWSADIEMTMIELQGPEHSTIAAWTRRKDGTWIFRFTAPGQIVNQHRLEFAGFLKSMHFAPE